MTSVEFRNKSIQEMRKTFDSIAFTEFVHLVKLNFIVNALEIL